ncbi:MAG: helix-turn-helix transcriptional regulator [Spirochaetaceae bacterium]|nr:helix-turn-helix transcriptional regulator [Spirochaetaceae bacterium]
MENSRSFLKPVVDLEATGAKIKLLRKSSGFSVHDLQDIFGFEYPQAIYAWEQGKNIPSIDNLLVLSNLFSCRVEEIVQVQNIEIEISCAEKLKIDKCHEEAEACESCKFKKIA